MRFVGTARAADALGTCRTGLGGRYPGEVETEGAVK